MRIGIGASSASSHSDTHDDIAYASHIQSAGDVTIAATNGDLNVIGSQVSGDNVALAASHDLNLLSQAEQHTQSDHSANARGELGFSIGSQTGFYATADGGKSVAHGNGTTYADTSVTASDTLSLVAGNDANIIGAQAKGNTVLASIGHDLTVESQQTTDDYARCCDCVFPSDHFAAPGLRPVTIAKLNGARLGRVGFGRRGRSFGCLRRFTGM